jgi:hypothetical protein
MVLRPRALIRAAGLGLSLAAGVALSVLMFSTAANANAGDAYSSAVMADAPLDWWRLNDLTGVSLGVDNGSNAIPLAYQNVSGRAQTPCLFALEIGCAYTVGGGAGALAAQASNTPPLGLMAANHAYTLEFAFRAAALPAAYKVVLSNRNENTTAGFLVYVSDTNHVELRHDGSTPLTSSTVVAVNVAYYVQIRYQPAGACSMWINGAQVAVNAACPSWGTPTNFEVGVRVDNQFSFSGLQLQDLAVYGTALSDARLSAHYAAALNGGAGAGTTTVTTGGSTTTLYTTTTTPGQTVTETALVRGELDVNDQQRLDYVWTGVWALVGVSLCALIASQFDKAWRFWRQ